MIKMPAMIAKRCGVAAALLLLGFVGLSPAGAQAAGDVEPADNTRVELEAKLKVPLDQLNRVWSWLEERYQATAWLAQPSAHYVAEFGHEAFVDTYFDTPGLALLEAQSGLRHRARSVQSGPAQAKDGRELIQLKLNRGDVSGLARSEIKFAVADHQGVDSSDDLHPMLQRVSKKDRDEFRKVVAGIGIDPYALRPVLMLHQDRRRVYLADPAGAFATLTLDRCATSGWGAAQEWGELELELNENRYTAADAGARSEMEYVLQLIQDDLLSQFPEIVQDQTPKYNTAFAAIDADAWFPLRTMIRWNIAPASLATLLVLLAMAAVAGGVVLIRGNRDGRI